jgi:hypothetical protein
LLRQQEGEEFRIVSRPDQGIEASSVHWVLQTKILN